jgi:hypothetical protein
MGNTPISRRSIDSYKVEVKEYAGSNEVVNSFIRGAGFDCEGPKTATRGGVNGSRKFSSQKFRPLSQNSPPNVRIEHRDVHDPNEWVDVPKNTVGYHKANVTDVNRIRAQTRKPRRKSTQPSSLN